MKTKIGFLLAMLFAAVTSSAQTSAFTYQGQLTEEGVPANGPHDFTFMLMSAAAGGDQVAEPWHVENLEVSNGVFTATVDFGTNAFDGSPRWLAIGVSSPTNDYQLLAPYQPLTALPYALRAVQAGEAATAATVTGNISATQLTGTISSSNVAPGTITSVMLSPGSVTADALASGAVQTATLAEQAVTSNKVLMRIDGENPAVTFAAPGSGTPGNFAVAVAALGTDRVAIGADRADYAGLTDAGAVHLFSLGGRLLVTLTNPAPENFEAFGRALAAVGEDKILAGAPGDNAAGTGAGAAYLLDVQGHLLASFLPPVPEPGSEFGGTLAAVGPDKVLIGAGRADVGASDAGAAYLFATNGTFLRAFTNPVPASFSGFGTAVAGVGADKILFGVHNNGSQGKAYLFSSAGALLTTFINPHPAAQDNFGRTVCAVGTDRVLIGANANGALGAAYLFRTNGTLLATFTNQMPNPDTQFGAPVAAIGSDKVLVGVFDGLNLSAHLFGSNGTLLAVYANLPLPGNFSVNGAAFAGVGNDKVLLGMTESPAQPTEKGVAYLFSTRAYAPGLFSEGVRFGGITTDMLATGSVTADKLGGDLTNLFAADLARLSARQTFTGSNVFQQAVGIGTATPAEKLHVIGNILASGTITGTSDRQAKENFATVNPAEVLAKLAALPISRWNYTNEAGVRHLGPMAQDFFAAFQVGMDERHISMVDADGVALAAIQGLNQKVEAQQEQLSARDAEIRELKQRLSDLEKAIHGQTEKK